MNIVLCFGKKSYAFQNENQIFVQIVILIKLCSSDLSAKYLQYTTSILLEMKHFSNSVVEEFQGWLA